MWRKVEGMFELRSGLAGSSVPLLAYKKLTPRQPTQKPDAGELGDGIFTYKESLLVTAIGVFTTLIAAILPVLSTVILFFLDSNSLKVGMIVVFSTFFALALVLMTSARKIEVFAATSA
jgi:hypothetical protein